jgi:hypothetical protein
VHHDSGDRPAKGKPRHQTPGGVPSPLDAVRQLLAEKAKFEKWLTDLDAKRASTPAHVFERVHADYSGRLQGVVDRLKSHSAAMQDHAAALAKRLDQLTESEQGILDTRAESELRAQVGELAEADWEKISKKVERDIAKIKQDQALIASDLNELRGLLGSLDGRPAPTSTATPASADASESSETPTAPPKSDVDELAFLKSVIGTTPATGAASPAKGASEPAPAPAPAAPVAPPKPPVEKLVETPPPGPVIRSRPGEEPLAMHVTGANPIVLRSSGVVEQPKTMKCGECGSMNYPSEWYCERCGAELTSV